MPGQGLRVEALGVAGAPAPDRLTTTFRLTGGVILDTGAAAHAIAVAERTSVRTVLLSHAHLDHTLGLPFLLSETQVRVLGLKDTLEAVRGSLLDDRIWPNLAHLAEWQEIAVGDTFALDPWEVTVGPAHHTVPCISFAFRAEGSCVVIVGDTCLDEQVLAWAAAQRPDALVVETSFPDRLARLSRRYGHQTPDDLRNWRRAVGPECRLYATHLKPAHEESVAAECEALGDPRLKVLRVGENIAG